MILYFFIFFLILIIFFLVIFLYLNIFYSFYLRVPMLSAKKEIALKIIKNVDFKNAKNFYDLGSGNGRIISYIANKYPNFKCVGIEYNLTGYCLAKARNIFLKQKVDYRKEDFFKTDISNADIVYVYLFPGVLSRLEPKFSRELKKGTLVVSNTFQLKFKEPEVIIKGEAGALNTLYIYKY